MESEDVEAVLKPSRPGVIITISREHASSAKQIGKIVSEKLGIPFYYKETTALAAKECGLDREFISHIGANSPAILNGLYISNNVVQSAVMAQDKIIKRIADQGSCVIVGRAADYVLRNNTNLLRVFIYAPEDFRINRIMEIYGDDRAEAERYMRQSDAARASYYKSISGKAWGDRHNYDVVLNSAIGLEETADIICKHVTMMGN